jgi:hypothetical protein
MTAQLSPEQVRSLLAGTSSGEGEQESMTAGGPGRVYRVVWDRCAVCKERHQGLWPHRAPGPHPRIEYVCGWCWKELGPEKSSEHDDADESDAETPTEYLFEVQSLGI